MNSERVILINGNGSNWYEQAIFIVKGNVPKTKMPVDLVAEAEKIISGYSGYRASASNNVSSACTQTRQNKKAVKPEVKAKKKDSFDVVLNVIMLVCCIIMAGILYTTFS